MNKTNEILQPKEQKNSKTTQNFKIKKTMKMKIFNMKLLIDKI